MEGIPAAPGVPALAENKVALVTGPLDAELAVGAVFLGDLGLSVGPG